MATSSQCGELLLRVVLVLNDLVCALHRQPVNFNGRHVILYFRPLIPLLTAIV